VYDLDKELPIAGCRLKEVCLRKIGPHVPTYCIKNSTNHLRLGVNSTTAVQGLNLRRDGYCQAVG
jgi:hypothetical protein